MEDKDKLALFAFVLFIVGVVTLGWIFVRVDHVETMTVRSKEWYRIISELEDYRVLVPHTTSSTSCSGTGNSRHCTTRTNTVMVYKTRTRTINSYPSQGTYPDKPFWRTDYTIGWGHYERRSENYVIRLSDDKEIWTYSVGNEGWYDTFPVRGECLVGINWFNVILKVEC